MKILVTGGAGFIGSHVADAYSNAGHEVAIIDWQASRKRRNIAKGTKVFEEDIAKADLRKIFEQEKFDVINHHAAQASVPVSVKDPIEDARINIMGLLNILEAARATGVKRVIFAQSGGTVYGPTDKLPAHEDLPFDAASPYGVAKVASELYLRTYKREHGLNYVALRYANVYGPRQDAHGESGVVSIFIERMTSNGKPMIHGDGEYLRDYVYVGDVARANVIALTKGDNDGINIGTGVRTSTNTVFRTLAKLTNFQGPEEHGPPRPGDLRDSCLAIAKAEKVLGWKPEVDVSAGLAKTVEWFRALPKS